MKIVCGLGNPGSEYARHRHNIGFRIAEALLSRARGGLTQDKFDGRLGQVSVGGEKVLVVEPQTFMNRSGDCLAAAARFYKIGPDDVIVVHDELDLPFGRLQLKAGGGSGGHNGLKSIVERWGEDGFARLRVGIGKPEGPNAKERVAGYVLSGFSSEEQPQLDALIDRSAEACEAWVRDGLSVAMNRYNRR